MKKKILQRSLLGAPIGVFISLIITIIISLCVGHGEYFPAPHELIDMCDGNEITAVIIQMLCSMIIGAIFGGASVIWETEKWSLLRQTVTHFVIITIPSIFIGYIVNWIPHNSFGALCYAGEFGLIYLIIWVSKYFSIKSKIKKMDKQLQKMRQNDD